MRAVLNMIGQRGIFGEADMRISLVGGIDRLQRHYRQEAKDLGVELQIFNRSEINLQDKLGQTTAVVLFTSKVSHRARLQVMGVAQARSIPVFQSHNCGICALRDCLNCVKLEISGKHSAAA
jgi:hypothetical protein